MRLFFTVETIYFQLHNSDVYADFCTACSRFQLSHLRLFGSWFRQIFFFKCLIMANSLKILLGSTNIQGN